MVWMLGLGPYWPRTTICTVSQAAYRSYCPVLYRKVLISAHFPLRGSEPEQASQCRRLGICAYKLHREARGDYTNNISRVYSIIPTAIGPGGGYKMVTISPWNPPTRVNSTSIKHAQCSPNNCTFLRIRDCAWDCTTSRQNLQLRFCDGRALATCGWPRVAWHELNSTVWQTLPW